MKPICPFSILEDFEKWFLWHKFIIADKLTEYQTMGNIQQISNGWEICPGFQYGCWTKPMFDNNRNTIKNLVMSSVDITLKEDG